MYATLDDMTDRFRTDELIQLTDEAGTGVVDATLVTAALTDAAHVIDSYLSGTYKLPLNPVPGILKLHACTLARWRLYKNGVPERVQADYDATLDWLKMVARGAVKLEVLGVEAPSAPATIVVESSPRLFSRDTMGGY